MNVTIRLAQACDLAAADRVFCTAFGRRGSFLAHLRLHLAVEPEMFWLAVENGRIVGTAGAVDYGAMAYVGLMAVDPARQRRGIASRLLERVLSEIDARGCRVARLDATDMGAPLYEKFGFVDDGMARVFQRERASGSIAGARAGVAAASRIEEIVEFDASAFGARRQGLLAALWSEHRKTCLVARAPGGQLLGYLFAQHPTLGPWVAADDATAEALLAAALRFDTLRPPHVMVPRSNAAAARLLAGHGFHQRRELRHMRRGDDSAPGRPDWLYGQSSFAHG